MKHLMFVSMLVISAGAALAQDSGGSCSSDIAKFCKGTSGGWYNKSACLMPHKAELSQGCKNVLEDGARKTEAMKKACEGDISKFCAGSASGEEIICLKAREKELSAGCGSVIAAVKAEFNKKNPCSEEIFRLCGKLKPGPGPIQKCISQHGSEFSETCKASIQKRKTEMSKKNPCMNDVQKFCKDTTFGGGRMLACLKSHDTELSASCRKSYRSKLNASKSNAGAAAESKK